MDPSVSVLMKLMTATNPNFPAFLEGLETKLQQILTANNFNILDLYKAIAIRYSSITFVQ